jgi:hypothetical protein
MKSFNMVSLMAKASRNNKSAVARSEEAKKEALAAREAREAERKAKDAERLEKKAQEKVTSPLEILKPKGIDTLEIDPVAQNLSSVRSLLDGWKSFVLTDPNIFMTTFGLVFEVAEELQAKESLRLLETSVKAIKEYHGLAVRLHALRDRQTKVKTNCMAKVIPWDQAAREAVVLAEDAFGANAPEIGKEAKRLLNDINLTK